MILVDSNVLIALADRRDRLYTSAAADLRRLVGHDLMLTSPVLTEVCFGLSSAIHRARVRDLIRELRMRPLMVADGPHLWQEVFAWLERYAEHEPDWTDAHLAVLCGRDRELKVWTYDQEFVRVWRRPDGSRIPLASRLRGSA